MADHAGAFNLDAHQQGVAVAVGAGGDHAQAVAGGLTLGPELLAGAAEEGDVAAGRGCARGPLRFMNPTIRTSPSEAFCTTAGIRPPILSKSSSAFIASSPGKQKAR